MRRIRTEATVIVIAIVKNNTSHHGNLRAMEKLLSLESNRPVDRETNRGYQNSKTGENKLFT